MENTAIAQILEASVLGTEAFKNGLGPAPFYDTEVLKLIGNRGIGQTPPNEASTVSILKAWQEAYNNAKFVFEYEKSNNLTYLQPNGI